MHARAFRLRPASYGPYALAILPALLASAACHAVSAAPTLTARRGVPQLPSVKLVPADAPSRSAAPSFGEAVLAAANARAATASTCASGFADLAALRRAACSADDDASGSPAVDWDAFDAAYAEAGRRAGRTKRGDGLDEPDAARASAEEGDPLRVPSGCAFGCIPSKPSDESPLARVAAALPWGGKCFTRVDARDVGSRVAPTLPDGKDEATRVLLVANVTNRIVARNRRVADTKHAPDEGGASEHVAAPARAYFGASAFDERPALVVDYRGQRRFGRFRDEVRHVGCGVWLGKTYLLDGDDDDDAKKEKETLAESLAAVGGVRLSPVVTAVVERAMPVREPGAPPPHVLDFALFATTGEAGRA